MRRRYRTASRGFSYFVVLFTVATTGIALAQLGVYWQTAQAREREEELLYVGHAYRRAIELYYNNTPGPAKRYPRELSELLSDSRQQSTRRYLRKLYPDPMTGQQAWGIVNAPDGGIAGVYSTSEKKPFKSGNFSVADAEFQTATKYSDWKFAYLPNRIPPLGSGGVRSGVNNARPNK